MQVVDRDWNSILCIRKSLRAPHRRQGNEAFTGGAVGPHSSPGRLRRHEEGWCRSEGNGRFLASTPQNSLSLLRLGRMNGQFEEV